MLSLGGCGNVPLPGRSPAVAGKENVLALRRAAADEGAPLASDCPPINADDGRNTGNILPTPARSKLDGNSPSRIGERPPRNPPSDSDPLGGKGGIIPYATNLVDL